jgi:hypothetical protein
MLVHTAEVRNFVTSEYLAALHAVTVIVWGRVGRRDRRYTIGVLVMLIDCPAGSLKGKYVLEDMEVDGG